VRGLPEVGDSLNPSTTVVMVHPHADDTRWDKGTVKIPAYSS